MDTNDTRGTDETQVPFTFGRVVTGVGGGLLAGAVILFVPWGLLLLYQLATHAPLMTQLPGAGNFTGTITLLFPLVQGLGLGLALGRQRAGVGPVIAMTGILFLIEVAGAAIFLREGIICLIIISPLIIGLMLLGALAGRLLARMARGRSARMSLVPLLFITALVDLSAGTPDSLHEVADSVTINAPPAYVWRYIVQYPENTTPPQYWLWQAGLPEPIQSVAEAPRVGATRLCKFKGGYEFAERITELEPEKLMTFEVTSQPDHPEITGHFRFTKGQLRLKDNGDGTTTVTAISWYHLYVRPSAYFQWWTDDITRKVHFRVMGHMKDLAERDFAAKL